MSRWYRKNKKKIRVRVSRHTSNRLGRLDPQTASQAFPHPDTFPITAYRTRPSGGGATHRPTGPPAHLSTFLLVPPDFPSLIASQRPLGAAPLTVSRRPVLGLPRNPAAARPALVDSPVPDSRSLGPMVRRQLLTRGLRIVADPHRWVCPAPSLAAAAEHSRDSPSSPGISHGTDRGRRR